MPWRCSEHGQAIPGDKGATTPKCRLCKSTAHVSWKDEAVEFSDAKKIRDGLWVENHQGKHTVDPWPGYSGKKGSMFKKTLVGIGNYTYLSRMWNAAFPSIQSAGGAQGYAFFESGSGAIGTSGEMYAAMQWVKDQSGAYLFHAYPTADKLDEKEYVRIT